MKTETEVREMIARYSRELRHPYDERNKSVLNAIITVLLDVLEDSEKAQNDK